MNIRINTIPHNQQRYETAGDWQFLGDELVINVSDMDSFAGLNEFLVGIHELIEAMLCRSYGIKEQEVDDWDKAHIDDADPGAIPGCPYYRQHFLASIIERMLADELDVNWNDYEEAIENL